MKSIDINSDLGESFGHYRIGCDDQVLDLISSANIACGFHASDPVTMDRTVLAAAERGVHIGAHPGFPDLEGFGRRKMFLSPEEIKCSIIYQIGALEAFCSAHFTVLCHIKPHGALYNMAVKDEELAGAIVSGILSADPYLTLLAPYGSALQKVAEKAGLPFAAEVFADRGYMDDGSLVPRGQPGAMITDPDEAAGRVLRMIEDGVVKTVTGNDIPIRADSVCIHGDSPKAVAFAKTIREALERDGVCIQPF